MSRNVVGSWSACRSHDKVLRRMMEARRKSAMERGTNNGARLVRLELQCVAAPATLHEKTRSGANSSNSDPFDARLLVGGGGGGGGGQMASHGDHQSRLRPDLDLARFAALIVAEAEEEDEERIRAVESSHTPQHAFVAPTQHEQLLRAASAAPTAAPAAPEERAHDQHGVKEARGEAIANRYGIRNFFAQLRHEEAKEREDAAALLESSGKRRTSRGGRDSNSQHEHRVRLRDEQDGDDVEDEEDAGIPATDGKKQKIDVQEEEEEESADNPQKQLARMLAKQIAVKREADLKEEERRRESAKDILIDFEKKTPETQKKEESKKNKKKKDKKKDKKKEKKEKKKIKLDPLDAALDALKKKHKIN